VNPHFLFRHAVPGGAGPHADRLVVFAAGRRFDMTRFAQSISAEISERLVPDELVVVARSSVASQIIHAAASREFGRLRQRLGNQAAVTVIGYDHAGIETQRTPLGEATAVSNAGLPEIWRRGGTEVFRRRGGFFESTTAFHFANPSGKHTNRFIRLSNILVSHAEIDFIAATCLHLVQPTAGRIYIDTPSLFSVVAAINDVRAAEANLDPITADSFRSYDGVAQHAFDYPEASVLISASSSGSLARVMVERGFAIDQISHVLFLGRNAEDARCAIDLGHDARDNPDGFEVDRVEHPSGQCRMCAANSQAVPLRGDQFDIAGPQPEPLLIKQGHRPPKLEAVMDIHVGSGLFQIGGADTAPCRLDAARLFASDEGGKRRDYVLDLNVPAAAAAVLVVDEASRPFAIEVATRVSGTTPVETLKEFELRIPADPEFVQPILVVQAVVGSGRQIVDLSRDLRRWPAAPIVYVAGFVTTESAAKVEALRANLEMTWNAARHRLVVVDQLALPAKGEANAWEAEAQLLDAAASGGGLTEPELVARRAALGALASGMRDDIFHRNAHGQPLGLNPGFVFWPDGLTKRPNVTQADVFATISSVLQRLRNGDDGKTGSWLRTAWFHSTVLDPENFGRYNDGVIQASLLRAARPSELDYRDNPAASREAARLIRRMIDDPGSPRGDAAREFALALATRRMRLQDEDAERLLAVSSGDGAVDELLRLAGV